MVVRGNATGGRTAATSTSSTPRGTSSSFNQSNQQAVGRWKLRGFHSISGSTDNDNDNEKKPISAHEIFRNDDDEEEMTKSSRSCMVDGRDVVFELRENMTQAPLDDRQERVRFTVVNKNVTTSHWEVRLRTYMIKFSIVQVSIAYFALFLLVNFVFAVLFYIHPNHCCDDASYTFAEVFDFTIQTSTTIGYGSMSPHGLYQNFLVVILSYVSVLLNTVLAGLLFLKFVTPVVKIDFSNVMTLCNTNGLPCLSVRVGNADGNFNSLVDVHARLTYFFNIDHTDKLGRKQVIGHTQELKLLNDHRSTLTEVWTLQHVIDETSPLFGLHFDEYPGNLIGLFRVTINAMQETTMSPVTEQSSYQRQDVLIGHKFADQVDFDQSTGVAIFDYNKMNETIPSLVWYPAPKKSL